MGEASFNFEVKQAQMTQHRRGAKLLQLLVDARDYMLLAADIYRYYRDEAFRLHLFRRGARGAVWKGR